MTRWALLALLLLAAGGVSSQEKKVRDRSQDAFEELESGKLTLRFFNALTGSPIIGGSVTLRDIGTFTTDVEGKILFPAPEEDGTLPVVFQAEGYVTSEFDVEILTGSVYFNRYSISPAMDLRFIRIVLDWGAEPRDLDLHFLKVGGYHISFRDMRTSADGTGSLDHDALDGFGPETITVREVFHGDRYECFVHDYTDRHDEWTNRLSRSRATVKVFGSGRLLHVFRMSGPGPGRVWHVFDIVGGVIRESGSVTP